MRRSTMEFRNDQPRSAFTLTELLVVISIIGVVTSALAFTVAGAQERARELRTRSQMQRIEAILQRELLELLEARVPVRTPPVGDFPMAVGAHQRLAQEGPLSRIQRFTTEARRVDVMYRFPFRRELIQPNMGDSITRPTVSPLGVPSVYFIRTNGNEDFQPFHSIPNDLQAIRNLALGGMGNSNAKTDSSELLHAVLQRIWVDGEPALSLIRETETADTDEDGFPEIVDAWGNPIYFRLEVRVEVTRTVPATPGVGLFNMPLDQFSAWMTEFSMQDGQTFVPTAFSADVFSPERVRVVLYSTNVSPGFDPDNLSDPRALDFKVSTF